MACFVLVALSAVAIEAIGVHTGYPFGRYRYTASLQPQVFAVPILVALAWFAMLLPAWDIARRISRRAWLQCLLTGAALAVWDIFLDPQMTRNGFWVFASTEGINGIPVTNTLGWILGGALLAIIPTVLLDRRSVNNGLAFAYVWMIGFSALGFLIPFALDDWRVAITGIVSASPLLYFALGKKERSWLA